MKVHDIIGVLTLTSLVNVTKKMPTFHTGKKMKGEKKKSPMKTRPPYIYDDVFTLTHWSMEHASSVEFSDCTPEESSQRITRDSGSGNSGVILRQVTHNARKLALRVCIALCSVAVMHFNELARKTM